MRTSEPGALPRLEALRQRLYEEQVPAIRQRLDLFIQVCRALQHAHQKGVIHRDVKPANILLDQDHRPRLADFGQSRLSHEQTPALGTLFYMAPEQASGCLDEIDCRTDVYGLGALLYEILTGLPPFSGAEGQEAPT